MASCFHIIALIREIFHISSSQKTAATIEVHSKKVYDIEEFAKMQKKGENYHVCKRRCREIFYRKKYNCCQAVICAYCKNQGIDDKDIFKLTEGFGLGMGGLKDTCGAVTGMFMSIGMIKSCNRRQADGKLRKVRGNSSFLRRSISKKSCIIKRRQRTKPLSSF